MVAASVEEADVVGPFAGQGRLAVGVAGELLADLVKALVGWTF